MHVPCRSETARCATLDHPVVGALTLWQTQCQVGESPHWHAGEESLYWIDVRAPQVLRLHPQSRMLTRWDLPDVVGALAMADTGDLWLAMRHGLARMELASGRLEAVAAVEPATGHNRLNDGKVSPSGRWFVFGSMDDRPQKQPTGALYRAASDGSVVQLADRLTVANGIAWNLDGSALYFSDSFTGQLYRAAWDEATGVMGAPAAWQRFTDASGRPDGGLVDSADHYWSAGVSAGRINRLDSAGALVQAIDLPCRAPTMCALGGAGLATMFVTSLVRPQWPSAGPADGAVLSFQSNCQGVAQPALTS